MKIKKLFIGLIISTVLFALVACVGESVITMSDIPVYIDAVELKAGESTVGDILDKDMQQDMALRQTLGLDGLTQHKGFKLSADTSWSQVRTFYEKELGNAGWSNGLGGTPTSSIVMSTIVRRENRGNDLFKTAIWSKDKQVLTVMMVINPLDPNDKALVLSLSTP